MASSHSPYPSHPLGLYPPNTVPSVVTATRMAAPWPSSWVWKALARHPWTLASYAMPRGWYSSWVCAKTARTRRSSSVSSDSRGSASVPSHSAGHWSGQSSLVMRFSPMGSGSSSASLPKTFITMRVTKSSSSSGAASRSSRVAEQRREGREVPRVRRREADARADVRAAGAKHARDDIARRRRRASVCARGDRRNRIRDASANHRSGIRRVVAVGRTPIHLHEPRNLQ